MNIIKNLTFIDEEGILMINFISILIHIDQRWIKLQMFLLSIFTK